MNNSPDTNFQIVFDENANTLRDALSFKVRTETSDYMCNVDYDHIFLPKPPYQRLHDYENITVTMTFSAENTITVQYPQKDPKKISAYREEII